MTKITETQDIPSSVTKSSLNGSPSSESAPAPPAPVDEAFDDWDTSPIPESNGPVSFVDGVVQVTTITYSTVEEQILADLAIAPDDAALAGVTFVDGRPVAGPRAQGGLYQAPGLPENLETADRIFVTCTALESTAGNAHGMACVALDGAFTAVPPALLEMIEDRALVLLKHAGVTPGNDSLIALEKALRSAAPGVPVVFGTCPEPKELKLSNRIDVTLCHWLKARTASGVNSLFSQPIRVARAPVNSIGGFDPCGFSGKNVVVFSRSRDTIVTLSTADLKDEMALGMAVGAKHLQRNYTTVNAKTGEVRINAKALGMEMIEACEPLDEFDGNRVYAAGVWRNRDGDLVVNSRQAFTLDGKPAKRIDGRDFYVAARDLGITPATPEATAAEAKTAYDLMAGYNFKTRAGAMLVFGWTMDVYTCAANDGRPVLFQVGPPGSGKSTVLNIQRSLLGEACDHLVGTTEAYLRQMNGLNSLGLLLDESEQREDNAGEFNKIVNFARQSTGGGTVGRGAGDGGAARKFTVRSAVSMVANRLPKLQPADVTRMLFVHYTKIARSEHMHSPLMPNPRSLRFPRVEALGRKLFMRMLQANERNAANKAVIERNIKTDSSRALMTLAPAIASAYTALHDDLLNDATAQAWLAQFDIAEAVGEIEDAQRETRIVEFLATKPAPRWPASNPKTIEMLWADAYASGDETRKAATAALMVMGMRVRPGKTRGTVEIRIFHGREGLRELFAKSEWEFAQLGKALCEDERCNMSAGTAGCPVDPKKAVGKDGAKTTPERYVTLEWNPAEPIDPKQASAVIARLS